MDGVSIYTAVEKLEATTIKERSEGLAQLRRLFKAPSTTLKLRRLGDDGWHKILETLFGLARSDLSSAKHGSENARRKALTRLESTASAVTLVVEFCAPLIKHKTAYAVLDHIEQTLPSGADSVFQFVQIVYFRAFHLILSHPSHGEHLRPDRWMSYIDFVLEAINAGVDEDDMSFDRSSREQSILTSTARSIPILTSQKSQTITPKNNLLAALRDLTSISNCPLRMRMSNIASTVLEALANSLKSPELAFEILNNILKIALTDDISLSQHIVSRAIISIKDLWSGKSSSQLIVETREQIVICLYLGRNLIRQLAQASPMYEDNLRSLEDRLTSEYQTRSTKDVLQFADLILNDPLMNQDFFSRSGIAPNPRSSSSFLDWTTAALIANMRVQLAREDDDGESSGIDGEEPKKKPRRSIPVLDALRPATMSASHTAITELQFGFFMLDGTHASNRDLHEVLEQLVSVMSDEQSSRPSWIMLIFARLASLSSMSTIGMHHLWPKIWTSAARLITSFDHSRCACFLLSVLLNDTSIMDSVRVLNIVSMCFPPGLRGPADLSDGTLLLLRSCALSGYVVGEKQIADFRDKVLNWLSSGWTLRSTTDRGHNSWLVHMARPHLIFNLLADLLGSHEYTDAREPTTANGKIYSASQEETVNLPFSQILVGQETNLFQSAVQGNRRVREMSSHDTRSSRAVSEFLVQKCLEFSHLYEDDDKQKSQSWSIDMLETVATLCMVACTLPNLILSDRVTDSIRVLWHSMLEVLAKQEKEQFHLIVPKIVRASLCVSVDCKEYTEVSRVLRSSLLQSLYKQIEHSNVTQVVVDDIDAEFMDSAASGPSQQSQTRSQQFEQYASRKDISTNATVYGEFVESKMQLLVSSLLASAPTTSTLSASIIDAFMLLDPEDLLLARAVLLELLGREHVVSNQDACRLLTRVAEVYLQNDNFERNEVALCFCLQVTIALKDIWLLNPSSDLGDVAFDVYGWYVSVALGKGVASQRVLYVISELLDIILRENPRYGTESLPSARTSLLHILKLQYTGLKYRIIPTLSGLFEGFVLTEHAAIFDDIVDCLPTDPDGREGIALRIYVLAVLGSRWKTVLRQAVYHIFETVANVPTVREIATSALWLICKENHIKDPQSLLHIFAPQILFTWLENSGMETIPYEAFAFSTLNELLTTEQEELVAQVVIRRDLKHVALLENILEEPFAKQVELHFPRAQVYAIVTDIAVHRSGAEKGQCECFLTEYLGETSYKVLASHRFAEAVAIVFLSLTDERGFDKVLTSSSRMSSAAESLDLIKQRGSSDTDHPSRQQPSFRAKYLLQILSKLAHTAGLDFETIWTPALLVYVYRKIFDDTEQALGSLHVASAIRRLRIVVALARENALCGYPLEMVLRNLKPYLTKFHCVEDSIGLLWYLLENSHEHLQRHAQFLTELSVLLFTTLSIFATSSQESTTQEAEFVTTISKANEFRDWAAHYLLNLQPVKVDGKQLRTLREIFETLRNVGPFTSSDSTTAEGKLLHLLLIDQTFQQPLLSRDSFHMVINSLTRDFRRSRSLRDDILCHHSDLILYAPILASIPIHSELSKEFQSWMASKLGRAFIQVGPALQLLTLTHMSAVSKIVALLEPADSCCKIMDRLVHTSCSVDGALAGHAERTLSLLLSTMSADDRYSLASSQPQLSNLVDLTFDPDECPGLYMRNTVEDNIFNSKTAAEKDYDQWVTRLAASLTARVDYDPFMIGLNNILNFSAKFAEQVLPFLVHLALFAELDRTQQLQQDISRLFDDILRARSSEARQQQQAVLKVILYLRQCTLPKETTMARRNSWLDIDFSQAASAALACDMPETALIMLEIERSEQSLQTTRSRRSSTRDLKTDSGLLKQIYSRVDDHDFFYGDYKEHDLNSVLMKLEHESLGEKSLSFQSALLDATTKSYGLDVALGEQGSEIVSALGLANLDALACITQQYSGSFSSQRNSTFKSDPSLNVHEWDLTGVKVQEKDKGTLRSILHEVSHAQSKQSALDIVIQGHRALLTSSVYDDSRVSERLCRWSQLAALSEVEQMFHLDSEEDVLEFPTASHQSLTWNKTARFDNVLPILLARETTLAMARRRNTVEFTALYAQQALVLEVKAIRSSLAIGMSHEAAQFCLNRATFLVELGKLAQERDVHVQTAINFDLANTLWAQGEATASIEILRSLQFSESSKQNIQISDAELLTELGQKLSEARLDRPDDVIANYLKPAIEALGADTRGLNAGKVFHNFAAFCEKQLQDVTGIDDFKRAEHIRTRKYQEVGELAEMVKKAEGKTRDIMKMHYSKAKTWLKLDDEEYQRLRTNRESLLRSCLENYLLSMQACDDYSRDVLRFLALWLSSSANEDANISVQTHLALVPTMKFAPFVNQLMSRLVEGNDRFQKLLFDLLSRVCYDHPYHSLYQLFATWKTKGSSQDEVARSRHKAAENLAKTVRASRKTSASIWIAIHNSSITLVYFANEKPEKDVKTGSKVPLRKFQHGKKLEQDVADLSTKIPPPTMRIALRPDKDYSTIPVLDTFDPQISIAGGVSAPKIVTVIASDGSRHKMLLKGGNDDLRQDAIMEQVFDQVSDLLEDYTPTRERKLMIRTYKVIPLTQNAGIIEFVQNTTPLHDYLLPAHQRYYPKDYKPNQCRRAIADAQTKPIAARIQAYRTVTENFHPVMRFFFMEHFLDPSEWFHKRLAYSRSTAAISILGHVLGLGDRHGHNILLDTQTGEVVHIDLGVAFEAGRVLPVPEVVPFRLTRDLVDGMGLSGVEGPFRRCCNFTLEALRKNQDAIMTILDVLRYDPLYSWSVSPLRLQRMQDNQEREAAAAAATATSTSVSSNGDSDLRDAARKAGNGEPRKEMINEPGEADRALAVVAKKLSAGLSVEATVNELIRQAMDERNLAVLYCGWAAYA